jgi:hypothetical protein
MKPSTRAELNASYARAIKEARKGVGFIKPRIIRVDSKPYYWVGHRETQVERDKVADAWRESGFNIRTRDNYIYARRK